MPYGWTEHVGEFELWLEGSTREEVFVQALAAVGELLGDERPPSVPLEARAIVLAGDDLAVLLADWIAELAFLAETDGFVADVVEELELAPGELRAGVGGHRGAPPHLVKAVTYHRLAFERRGDGWRAVAVLDV